MDEKNLPPIPPPDPWEDTIVGWEKDSDEPVAISAKARCEHTLLLGKTGQGKSNLMRFWMRQDVEAGRGFCCLDPHGKLIEDVLKDIPLSRQDDVIYLDVSDDDWPFGLNLFACPRGTSARDKSVMIDQIVQVFAKCWGGGFASTTEEFLKVIAQTFMDNRRGTMAMIPRLLTDRDYRDAFLPRITNTNVQITWKRATNARTGELKSEEVTPTLRRMNKFLMNPVIANIVGQEKTSLDFPAWMAGNKIVLIKLPDFEIGEEAVELIGTVIMQLILRAAYSRAVGSVLYPIYADEFQHYVTPDIPKILQNVRKYGVGLCLGTQSFSNVHDDAIRDGLLGAGSLICYQVTEKDARIVAGEFRNGMKLPEDWEEKKWSEVEGYYRYTYTKQVYHRPGKTEIASRLANLRGLAGVGHVLVKVGGKEYVVKTPNLEATNSEGSIAKRGMIIRQSRELYCRSRIDVEREIRAELLPDDGECDDVFVDEPPRRGAID